jgi:hypothetical protein
MKITKQIAKNITDNLLEKKEKELNNKIIICKIKVREEYLKLLPKEILEAYNKYPNYITTTFNVGYNLVGDYCIFEKEIPYNQDKEILLKQTSITDLRKLLKQVTDLAILKNKTEASIYSLRTSKNVEIMFPEAIPYLPKESITDQIAINFKNLSKEISEFPQEIKKETKEEKIAKVKEANKIEVENRNLK